MGGSFIGNEASHDGGVIFASDDSTTKLTGGLFETNVARDGGVVIVCDNATLRVIAANVSGNDAHEEGGAFSVDEGGNMEVGEGVCCQLDLRCMYFRANGRCVP